MLLKFAIRDAVVLVLTAACWWLGRLFEPDTAAAAWLSVFAGAGAVVCAYNLHEWGHLVGAHLTRSVYVPARRVYSPFLFSYDSERNNRRQFLIMSLAGFAATALFVAAFAVWMPQDQQAGRIALKGAFVLAGLTVVFELPIFARALFGDSVPRTGLFDGPTMGEHDSG